MIELQYKCERKVQNMENNISKVYFTNFRAKPVADVIKELGEKPFLTDCNTCII